MVKARCQFRVRSVAETEYGDEVKMSAVTSGDDAPADQSFTEFTPSGELEFLVQNPALQGENRFRAGQVYFLDLTLVPVQED